MKKQVRKPELMAPVGSFDALTAAIEAGCDSVYFGVEQLNMRARSSHNFEVEDFEEIVKRAGGAKASGGAGIRTYVALNTLLYEHDLNLMKNIIDKAGEAGISGVIAADMAAVQYANERGLSVTASTQLSISNFEAVKFFAKYADIMVLARELDLKMVADICDRIKKEDLRGPSGELVKIEIFVHGALCIAPSGRCQMSILQTNTSAQRGACLHECRKKYRVIDDETGNEMMLDNQYVLSPKDLCTIGFLDRLIDAGVSILKIEGRGRSPRYVDKVVRAYREAVDAIADGTYSEKRVCAWMKDLKKVYNRGFCDGYYLGRPLPEWSGFYGSRSTEERIFAGIVKHYFPKAKVVEILLQANPLKLKDILVIMGNTTGVAYGEVTSLMEDDEKGVGVEREEVQNPATVTVPFEEKVRVNDKVYKIQKRVVTGG